MVILSLVIKILIYNNITNIISNVIVTSDDWDRVYGAIDNENMSK